MQEKLTQILKDWEKDLEDIREELHNYRERDDMDAVEGVCYSYG
jgi:hypothetical protein